MCQSFDYQSQGDSEGREPDGFDIDPLEQEIEQEWSKLRDVITDTRSKISNTFSLSLSGGGGALPCFPIVDWNGVTRQTCLSDYSSELSVLAAAIFFMCVIVGILIILR
ncbi:hypothetical protein SAMN02745729_13128 [Marinobacterium iners DSM 11526]|uniref:Uncharacterized protein n=2 Tax=Marinobacterium iners TaxID=48076 RepID=A0A1H4H7W9_9GAMM|nr:hypothetical protein SAMN02745729_13128 [Marinobacterium iners DSM 11526]